LFSAPGANTTVLASGCSTAATGQLGAAGSEDFLPTNGIQLHAATADKPTMSIAAAAARHRRPKTERKTAIKG
jgi:hypothetical protein